MVYVVHPNGKIEVSTKFNYGGNLKDAEMPRFGINFNIPGEFEKLLGMAEVHMRIILTECHQHLLDIMKALLKI